MINTGDRITIQELIATYNIALDNKIINYQNLIYFTIIFSVILFYPRQSASTAMDY